MATRFKSRTRRSRRYLTIVKPSGSLHPRVQKVGPEHFGIVAVDCAKARSKWILADFYGRILIPPSDSCLLTPAAIIHWFLIQVLHGNTALTDVSLLAGLAFTASAFCQARARLPLAVFQTVLRAVIKILVPATEVAGLSVRPSRLVDRRLVVLHARCRRAADLLRPAGQPGQGLRLPGGPHPGVVPRRHRAAAGGFGAPLRSHDMAGVGGILPC